QFRWKQAQRFLTQRCLYVLIKPAVPAPFCDPVVDKLLAVICKEAVQVDRICSLMDAASLDKGAQRHFSAHRYIERRRAHVEKYDRRSLFIRFANDLCEIQHALLGAVGLGHVDDDTTAWERQRRP